MILAPDCEKQTAGHAAHIQRPQPSGPARAMTVHGPKRLDEVCRGDVLETLAFGFTTLEWIGSTVLSRHDIFDMPYLAPVRIKSNAFAPGLPASDLLVTQQQRLFVNSDLAGDYFGSYEALVPAVDLLRIPGVTIANDFSEVTYFHMLFHSQEFIWVDGVLAEISYSEQNKLQTRSPGARRELAALFPEALDPEYI